MAIVRMRTRPNPVFDLVNNNLFQEFDRFFNEVASPVYKDNSAYQTDLYETDNELVLEMTVPGLKAENLDISIEDRDLSIKGKVNTEEKTEDKDRHYWMQSISRSEFARSMKLPQTVDVENIQASITDGILKLVMPKLAEAKVKKIAISNS